MDPDIANLPPPSEEEFRRLEAMPDDDDLFPGYGGIVAYRMRIRAEREARAKRFPMARGRLHKTQRPQVVPEAA